MHRMLNRRLLKPHVIQLLLHHRCVLSTQMLLLAQKALFFNCTDVIAESRVAPKFPCVTADRAIAEKSVI